jgi:hypothetical protein
MFLPLPNLFKKGEITMIRKLVIILSLLLLALPVFSQKMTAEDVVAKHLDSIGTAEARAGIQTFILTGDATVKLVSKRDLVLQGRLVLASSGVKSFFGMGLNSNSYPGEQFVFDGKKAKIAVTKTGDRDRSNLGSFVQGSDLIVKDGLLSGTLASSWVMANLPDKKAKLSFDGIKKIDGKDTYAIGYSRKGSGDLTITLFFDKETFRHVRTEYKRISSAAIGKKPEDSGGQNEVRFRVVEDFSDFKAENGITLPHNYHILYSVQGGQETGTVEIEFTFKLLEFAFNQKLDEKTFSTDANVN